MRNRFTWLLIVVSTLYAEAQIVSGDKKQRSKGPPSSSAILAYYSKRGNLRMTLYYTMQLGDSSRNSGNIGDAERRYQAAISMAEKIAATGGPYRNILLNSVFEPYEKLAELYLQTNNLRKAELYFEKATEEKNKHLAKHSVFRVSPYMGLGRTHLKKGDLQKAELNFIKAQKILTTATTSFYDFSIPQREISSGLYEIYMVKKNYKSALRYLTKSSSIGRYDGTDQIPRIFLQKADYYMKTGDYEKSRHNVECAQLYARGLTFSTVSHKIKRAEALLKWSTGDESGANKSFHQLIHSYKQSVSKNFASMTEYEREQFAEAFKEDFDLFASYVVKNLSGENRPALREELYNNQLFGKALLLNQINKLKSQIAKSDNADLREKLSRWEKEKARLTNLYFAKKKDHAAIGRAELYMEELESEINQASGLLGAMRNEINWQDVKGGLQEGEAAVEIVRVRKFDMGNTATKYNFTDSVEYAVLFIDKSSTGPQCFAIENGNDLEDRYLPYYRNSIQTKQPDTISYNRFWRPLKKHLGKYKRLFISCDGVYNQLNLHTLYNPASNLYLLDETNIVLVTNTKDILTPSLPFRVGRGSFFGRPNYKLNVPMPVATNLAVNRSMDDEAMENLRDHEFDDLPQTEEEIAAIGSLLLQYQWKFQSNTGDLATEANLKSVYNPTVLHLATHGFFLQSDLPNSNSIVGHK
jgi:hypothetical protein